MARMHGDGHKFLIKDVLEGCMENPGWYNDDWDYGNGDCGEWIELTFSNEGSFTLYWDKFEDAGNWIQNNIENWSVNVHWIRINDCSFFYFKHSKDAILFKLRWL